MSMIFTTLFQTIPRSPNRQRSDSWRADAEKVKRLVLEEGFQCHFTNEVPAEGSQGSTSAIISYFGYPKSLLTIQLTCNERLMTLDVTERAHEKQIMKYRNTSDTLYEKLQETLKDEFTVHRTAPLKRGEDVWRYSIFGDGRINEMDLTEIYVNEQSDFQRVAIAKTKEFGNILFLDWLENLSEADYSYTSSLCGLDKPETINYEGKKVLILGGGDGGALNELRKLKPEMITMIEIDEVVMKVCSKYLRGCCEDSLDKYEGDNYKIQVGDCIEYMRQYEKDGKKFDYIISDITDVPIVKKVNQDCSPTPGWLFFRQLFNSSLKLLNDEGQIFTHITASTNQQGIHEFELNLQQLDQKVAYELFDTFVPSFREKWMFCHMRKAILNGK